MASKERQFLQALEDLFVGATVEGDSGFVNLLRIKRAHFEKIRHSLMEEVDSRVEKDAPFREELFDKLHTFFSRYFCESGSVYFRNLPAFSGVYARVHSEDQDVSLAWKTRMLYYVKSDVLVQSMPVRLPDGEPHHSREFHFDAGKIANKRNNERRQFVHEFAGIHKAPRPVVCLKVSYSENGKKTRHDDIVKKAREHGVDLTAESLEAACHVFAKQTEVDFFINKNAGGFLREQFFLWQHQYVLDERNLFDEDRLRQLRHIKEIAHFIIDFVSQFEDETRRMWEKPKLARNVNYVVTIDRLSDAQRARVAKHKGVRAQIAEWKELGLVGDDFTAKQLSAGLGAAKKGGRAHPREKFLPIDTRHFKDIESDILGDLGDLDAALDGELIHSENWQALNTVLPRYRGQVACIYIDPPFNLKSGDQFDYRTNYKDSSWLTLLENRVTLGRHFLAATGSIFARCGHDGNHLLRALLNEVFGTENYRNEIVVRRAEVQKGELMKQFKDMRAMMVNYDNLYWYSVRPDSRFNFIRKPADEAQGKAQWHAFWKAEDRQNLRYKLLGVDLKAHGKGQWMWEEDRARRAVKNHEDYLKEHARSGISLLEYHEQNRTAGNGKPLEFIRGGGEGAKISSVKYWMPPRESVISDNNWMDIKGYSNTTRFDTENSEVLLSRIIRHIPAEGETVLDFFAGSGTTQAVAHKHGRKWLGVEMGAHFHSVLLPRMKRVLSGEQSGVSREADFAGGGAFVYYSLEQYEDVLRNARYKGSEPVLIDSGESPFFQYVFFGDSKLAWAVTTGGAAGDEEDPMTIDLSRIYPDIDIPVSLANIRGKHIRRRTRDSVTYSDGSCEKTDPTAMTGEERRSLLSTLRPYLWWGRD